MMPVLVMALMLSGCGKEEPVEEVIHRPPPPPPVDLPPPVKSVAELKAELRIDDRVYLPENQAPPTTESRRALLEFFDAFARGDHNALSRFLGDTDRRELEAMVASGDWQRATADITSVEIQVGRGIEGDAALALYTVGDTDYQPQMWYFSSRGGSIVFEAVPTPPDMMRRLSGADWIEAWHRILQEEQELAARPDTPVVMPQRSVEEAPGL